MATRFGYQLIVCIYQHCHFLIIAHPHYQLSYFKPHQYQISLLSNAHSQLEIHCNVLDPCRYHNKLIQLASRLATCQKKMSGAKVFTVSIQSSIIYRQRKISIWSGQLKISSLHMDTLTLHYQVHGQSIVVYLAIPFLSTIVHCQVIMEFIHHQQCDFYRPNRSQVTLLHGIYFRAVMEQNFLPKILRSLL